MKYLHFEKFEMVLLVLFSVGKRLMCQGADGWFLSTLYEWAGPNSSSLVCAPRGDYPRNSFSLVCCCVGVFVRWSFSLLLEGWGLLDHPVGFTFSLFSATKRVVEIEVRTVSTVGSES